MLLAMSGVDEAASSSLADEKGPAAEAEIGVPAVEFVDEAEEEAVELELAEALAAATACW